MRNPFGRSTRSVALVATTAVLGLGGLAIASAGSGVAPVAASFTFTLSHAQVKSCATGFDAVADARFTLTSDDPRLRGVAVTHLSEIASLSDDAFVRVTGVLRQSGRTTGTFNATGVDHGNNLDGVLVVRLSHSRGVIVANLSSQQDAFDPKTGRGSGHGELGGDAPLTPHNTAVDVRKSCGLVRP